MYRQCVYGMELWFVSWLRLVGMHLFVVTVKSIRVLWLWTHSAHTFFTTRTTVHITHAHTHTIKDVATAELLQVCLIN